jgi:pyruvate kinase
MNNHGGKNILAKGQGIGRNSASGRVVIAKNAEEALLKVKGGEILVTIGSDREMVPAIEKCCALIAEEGGLTSHAAIVGLNLGVPVLVGMTNATILLKEGQMVTVDAEKGMIYKGSTG